MVRNDNTTTSYPPPAKPVNQSPPVCSVEFLPSVPEVPPDSPPAPPPVEQPIEVHHTTSLQPPTADSLNTKLNRYQSLCSDAADAVNPFTVTGWYQ